jgi:hypothetical protein
MTMKDDEHDYTEKLSNDLDTIMGLPDSGNSPSSPEAGSCAQAGQAEPLTEEQFDQIQRAIYDLQESHTEGSPEDAAEAGAQAASHRLKVLLAKAGADETMIPGDAEVALSIAEGEA